jgi:hypothetical protein
MASEQVTTTRSAVPLQQPPGILCTIHQESIRSPLYRSEEIGEPPGEQFDEFVFVDAHRLRGHGQIVSCRQTGSQKPSRAPERKLRLRPRKVRSKLWSPAHRLKPSFLLGMRAERVAMDFRP